jgi:hypothetical protein
VEERNRPARENAARDCKRPALSRHQSEYIDVRFLLPGFIGDENDGRCERRQIIRHTIERSGYWQSCKENDGNREDLPTVHLPTGDLPTGSHRHPRSIRRKVQMSPVYHQFDHG